MEVFLQLGGIDPCAVAHDQRAAVNPQNDRLVDIAGGAVSVRLDFAIAGHLIGVRALDRLRGQEGRTLKKHRERFHI